MFIINYMTDQWTKVCKKKNTNKKSSKHGYFPPVMKKAPKTYPEMKNPNLGREIIQFKENDLGNNNISNLYIMGKLYDVELNRLNNTVSEQFNNFKLNELITKLRKCLDTINKFKRINFRNEDIANDLLKEIKNVYHKYNIEFKDIHFEDKFYDGQVYNIGGQVFCESSDVWKKT